jgi:glycosyltransferase involved in cell wall biosynthesis
MEREEDGMRVNIAVCGRFHYHQYVKYLHQLGVLEKVYFSHRWGFDFGVEAHHRRNEWLKEYAMRAHLSLVGDWAIETMMPIYHKVWEAAVLRDWVRPDLAHIMLHGTALRILQRCRKVGTPTIGEPVNAHPDVVRRILEEEYHKLGLRFIAHSEISEQLKEETTLCDWILAPSQWVAKSYVEHGFPESRIHVLPYPSGVGEVRRTPQRSNRRLLRILCVSSISVRKGQYYLVEAVKRLNATSPKKQYELTLVGGPERNLLKILKQMGLSFQHRRHVPNTQIIQFMREFDVFVLPSLEDGFGIVVGEALRARLPVVTTRNTGASDAIVDGVNGYVVEARDPVGLAAAIEGASNLDLEPGFTAPGQVQTWYDYTCRLVDVYRMMVCHRYTVST